MLATGVANAGTVDLTGLKVIVGDLSYQDDNSVNTINAGDLLSVGNLALGNLSTLATLNLGALISTADMNFTGLSTLQTLDFGSGSGLQTANDILITNTVLTSLKGISEVTAITGFSISNNPYLSSITLNVNAIVPINGAGSGTVDIGANDVSNGGQSISFPNLQTATEMTFRNASTISLPSLANVSQNLGFYDNLVKEVATPNLTFAGGIVIVDNTQLTNISMPMLTTINGTNGTYQIANNTLLTAINGFQDLTNVKGGLDFTGNFSRYVFPLELVHTKNVA